MHRAHSLADHIFTPSLPSQTLTKHPAGSLQLGRPSRTRSHSCQSQGPVSGQLANNIIQHMRQAHKKRQHSERAKTSSWSKESRDLMVEKKQLSQNKLSSPFQNKKLIQMRRPQGPRTQVDTPPQHYYKFIDHDHLFSALSRRKEEFENEEEDMEGSYLMSQQLRNQRVVKEHFRGRQSPERSPQTSINTSNCQPVLIRTPSPQTRGYKNNSGFPSARTESGVNWQEKAILSPHLENHQFSYYQDGVALNKQVIFNPRRSNKLGRGRSSTRQERNLLNIMC